MPESDAVDKRRLRPPSNRYDDRVVQWWRCQLLIATAVPVIPLAVLGILIAPARVWLLSVGGAILVIGVVAAIIMPMWWYRVHRWEITDNAVFTRTGYFWQNWRIAPISRIQTVDTTRGPVQRLFGLSTIKVTTASAAGEVEISGLEHEEAEKVAHDLALVTDATPGDAT